MATFASNGSFASSALTLAFSLTMPSSSHNSLYQREAEASEEFDFQLDFEDDFTIINSKMVDDFSLDSDTQSHRSTEVNRPKATTTPKSILKKPKGTNNDHKPKKAVVWHPQLAHDIINGEHVPQSQLSREEWYAQYMPTPKPSRRQRPARKSNNFCQGYGHQTLNSLSRSTRQCHYNPFLPQTNPFGPQTNPFVPQISTM